ncbi:MAG: acyl-CoA dehydrogenase family protein [Actinomycetes bacterium]
MDLLPTDEQSEIVATVRTQLERDFDLHTLAQTADFADTAISSELWQRCADLGWFALGLDEHLGGVGYSLVEEALLFAELGAHATPGPFLATVLATRLAATAGQADLARQLLSGQTHAALAEPDGDADAVVGPTVRGRFRITDLAGAGVVLVLTPSGAALVDAAEITATPEPSIDVQVPLSAADLDAVARCSSDTSDLYDRAGVLVAAELAGIATATAEQSTEYAKDREQFGTPIGAFQAVKHRCADMAVRAEAATCAVRYASLAVADGQPDAAFWTHTARSIAGDAAITNAQVNVQNHGGIGFTWEHTAHRFVTRAQVRSRTAGDRFRHLDDLLEQSAPD